ncbi:MAG: alpha/beta hydrolase [Acidimicrobiia bacterium]|nr:alpha/beta hydrolase [Acidimicrobiia bacterium]
MYAHVRRVAIAAGIVLVLLLLAGMTYQGVATSRERRDFPAPGRRVEVGDHQLHVYCSGEGRPVVVFEAPEAGMSAAWGWVQPEIAARTQACSYDRAGLGWSESSDGPFQTSNIQRELHALLAGAGLEPPYVLVGASLGAAYARQFAADYPSDVAALVLVDDATPDGSGSDRASRVATLARFLPWAPWLARIGVLRASDTLARDANGLPPASSGALRAFLNRPDHLARAARELASLDTILADAAAATLTVPITEVRTPGDPAQPFLASRESAEPVVAAVLGVTRSLAAVK